MNLYGPWITRKYDFVIRGARGGGGGNPNCNAVKVLTNADLKLQPMIKSKFSSAVEEYRTNGNWCLITRESYKTIPWHV